MGIVHSDDAYLGGQLNGCKACRGSENKIPLIAAWEMSEENRPIHLRPNRVSVFTSDAIEDWLLDSLVPGSVVFSDDLTCCLAGAAAGCDHVPVVIGGRKPKNEPLSQ